MIDDGLRDDIFDDYSAKPKAWIGMDDPYKVKIDTEFGVDVYYDCDGQFCLYVRTVYTMDALVALTQGDYSPSHTNMHRISGRGRNKVKSRRPTVLGRKLIGHKERCRLRRNRVEEKAFWTMSD